MPEFLIYGFAAMTLIFGVLVLVLRNPVASALSLVVSLVGVAGLFLSLDAYFIAVIQVLVYAGAVMVLFLFIIMLLDLKQEKTDHSALKVVVTGAGIFALFALLVGTALWSLPDGEHRAPPMDLQAAAVLGQATKLPGIKAELAHGGLPDTELMGVQLFTKYRFHLQMTGLLLVAATIGVVLLSRREPKI